MVDKAIALGQGYYWQQLQAGQRFRTFRRTLTEADLVGFIGVTGQTEAIFIDVTYEGAIKGRPVPAALSYSIIEGILMQTMLQGTGLALLELHKWVRGPVMVGDTLEAEVEILEVRPTSKNNRAVVSSQVRVSNQRAELVLEYEVKRLLAGRPEGEGEQ
ncbi:MaoC family dehydratase N-terminal domain-containing protein [Pseudomonas citronellolis]|uniref:MaoC family dehydratase N-terminal domain-containing protein n=1 Tax=Pseudomonas citronellolis TaxID=53408 RepID=A0AAW6P9D9_9PSED|nr:MaoC family dehydratase N-terminal domain-containing protein [Pseudomonas citronellolis]MDF3844123.1 MaoC family dehydratase N-terminal domain-containing protein [Pseudomonas citronellolis]